MSASGKQMFKILSYRFKTKHLRNFLMLTNKTTEKKHLTKFSDLAHFLPQPSNISTQTYLTYL